MVYLQCGLEAFRTVPLGAIAIPVFITSDDEQKSPAPVALGLKSQRLDPDPVHVTWTFHFYVRTTLRVPGPINTNYGDPIGKFFPTKGQSVCDGRNTWRAQQGAPWHFRFIAF
ncbi:hypothetical protein KAF25_001096 [Fusarium avenaceum]|uniref:Uncharacterized protein n=1 Tax=Fusarium avenaceum TaxID=40199 RepID=A0A9P7HCN1_9HYPO|nr:hypothetical protein KAF25_001096 [Fusarium avenaceum]